MKMFSLFTGQDLHLQEGQRLLKEEEVSLLLSAREVATKAEQLAARLRKRTQEKCRLLRKQAQEEGFQEGLDRWHAHLVDFEKQIRRLREAMQTSILPLALQAAKKIIGEELRLHPERIVDIVLQALAPVTQSRQVKIFVSKADREYLEQEKPRLRQAFEHLESLLIEERADIAAGGCVIETEGGILNASLENQWRALEAAFARHMSV